MVALWDVICIRGGRVAICCSCSLILLEGLLADYFGYSSDIVSDFEIQHTSSSSTSY